MIFISSILRVEIVSKGIGKVIPASRIQVVQPEYSGQIQSILVKNGYHVKKGELLITIDPTEIRTQLNSTLEEIERLQAERLRIGFIIDVVKKYQINQIYISENAYAEFMALRPDKENSFFNQQGDLLRAELVEIRSSIDQIKTRIETNKKSRLVTNANILRIEAALSIQKERLQSSETLLQKGVGKRSSYLDVLEAFTSSEKQRDIYARELDFKSSEEAALEAEQRNIVASLQSRYLQRKSEIEARLETLRENLISTKRQVANMNLTSPVNGIVDKLEVFTIGAIAKTGEPLMRIVPDDSNPELEIIFPNSDSGFLDVGQKANIKIDAFPSERFGHITGKVVDVSADAIEFSENEWGFVVRVDADTPYLQTPLTRHNLPSGMTATVDVITGDRVLISYFFAPIIKTIEESLGER